MSRRWSRELLRETVEIVRPLAVDVEDPMCEGLGCAWTTRRSEAGSLLHPP